MQSLIDVGLRVGTIMYRTGEIDNIVVEQRYKGKSINVGSDIITGEAIDLIVEVKSTTNEVVVPDILSKTESDAEILLWKAGLNVGRKIFQGTNEQKNTRVISYTPSSRRVMIGTAINLNLMNENEKAYKKQLEDFQQSQQIEEMIEENDTVIIEANETID